MNGTTEQTATSAHPVLPAADRYRDDPLLESWLRRMLPPTFVQGEGIANGDRQHARHARIEQVADAYLLHSSPDAGAWAIVAEARPTVECMWRSVHAASIMRRSLTVARSFGAGDASSRQSCAESAAGTDTLAALEAENWGAFLAAFLLVEMDGRLEGGEIDEQQRALLHLAAPVVALAAARQAVAVTSEVIATLGGAVQTRETGLAQLLHDALELASQAAVPRAPALDTLLAAELHDGLAALMGRASACLRGLKEPRLVAAARVAVGALERAALWLESGKDHEVLQAGARRLALTFARGLELALLCEHAQWMMDHSADRRGFAAALRFSRLPVDLVHEVDLGLDRALLAEPGK